MVFNNPSEIDMDTKLSASDDLRASDDTEYSRTGELGYAKATEIVATKEYSRATIRYKFEGKRVLGNGMAKVYKNGVAIGSEINITSAGYTLKTEDVDFTSIAVGDTIELWLRVLDVGSTVYVKNFRIYGIDGLYSVDVW